MKLTIARNIAERVVYDLAPHCEPGRCVVAGSVRRCKPEVGDIEVVCIPLRVPADLFGIDTQVDPEFAAAVNRWPAIKGQPAGRYTQRLLPEGINLDLFMATADNWGAILLIRTGPADYSRRFVANLLPAEGYQMDGGYVHDRRGSRAIVSTPEEISMFRLAKVPWLEPEDRH